MTVLIETSADRWTRMIRATGVVGLVTIVVLFAGVIASAPGERCLLASPGGSAGILSQPTAAAPRWWWRLWQRSAGSGS